MTSAEVAPLLNVAMTITPEDGEPFLRRLFPTYTFECRGRSWAVSCCWQGYWVTDILTGFAACGMKRSAEEAERRSRYIIESTSQEQFDAAMAKATEIRKQAELVGYKEERVSD